MDQERTILIVAVGVAVAVGCFVLWGPGTFRTKKKKGHVVGLVNLGHTCFLNTLLQGLASCPTVLDWILEQKDTNEDSLVSALRTVLLVLNGQCDSTVSDPYAPTAVISALIRHNWVISPGEQDAHELFHVLLETLEDEMMSAEKNGSLSDVLLLPERCGQGDDSGVSFASKRKVPNGEINCDGDQHTLSPISRFRPIRRIRVSEGDPQSTAPSVEKLPLHSQPTPPFRGTLTSQLICTQCGFKSALRFDKFDTLSLHLPSTRGQRLTLQTLLDNFVSTETVKDVTCTHCSKGQEKPVQTTAMKTLNFGKLPKCLCLHIVRTTWNKDGTAWKRNDYVDFPEFLVMDNYTHSQVQRNARKMVSALESDQIKDVPFKFPSNGTSQTPLQQTGLLTTSARHMYRLKAVVVHTGDVNSGHFITYRKGPINTLIRHRLLNVESKMEHPESRESTRWFFTSDHLVRRATMCDAMLSNAYMLFYERCVPPTNRIM